MPVFIKCLVDNNDLVQAIHSTKQVSEKRLRLEINCLKQMLSNKEINQVEWIETSSQLADIFTKRGASSESLLSVIEKGKVE